MKTITKINIKQFLGLTFVVNHNSGEIHNVDNRRSNCRLSYLTNYTQTTRRKVDKLYLGKEYNGKKYNGCRYCFKEQDTDK
jgi:hypothetical protein